MAGCSDSIENLVFKDEDPQCEDSMKHKRDKSRNCKTCGVCGDRALGYNFNAVTCESCKAFFRRNAFKDKQIKCLFSGNCAIDLRTRRFCPACRIKKCFEIGMKRDMILDDTKRKARMAKVLHNRVKKRLLSAETVVKIEPMDPDEFQVESSVISSPSCSESVQSPSASGNLSSTETAETEFIQISPDCFPTDPSMYRQLTEDEQILLNDIALCYETTVAVMPDIAYSKVENYQNANDLVNNSEMCVRQLIRFVKQLDDFRSLCQEDQITALKQSVMKSLLLRSVAFYIVEKDAWLTQKGEIPTSILREATGFASLHNMHIDYCRTLKAVILNNFTLYALMQIMLIFNPDGAQLVDRELMSNLQDKYINLLKHYLEAKYSFEFAQHYFVAILDKLFGLKKLSDGHSRILLQVNPSQIEPLMLEVLSLK